MMRFATRLAAGLILTVFAGVNLSAEALKVEFDSSPSAGDVLREARKAVGMPSLSPMASHILSIEKQSPSRNKGTIFGPFESRIIYSQPYKSAAALIDPIKKLPAEIQAPLNTEWGAIGSIRQDLLAAARPLDDEDGSLYDEAISINQGTAQLQSRLDQLNSDIANYNNQCAGRPVNQPCQDWYARLAAAKGQLERDIDSHNKRVDIWNSRYSALSASSAAHKKKVSDWESRIGAFIANANKALDDAKITTVRIQAQGSNPPVEKSMVASVPGGMCVGAGEQLLAELRDLLTPSELSQRDQAVALAQAFMQRCAVSGGCGPMSQHFYNDNRRDPDARIDVEIIRGIAFVDCPAAMRK